MKLPDAQFAALAPQPDSSAASPAPLVSPELLARIEGFGFATRPKMGMGGFIMLDIHPVVLFKSGDLLQNVAALRDSRGNHSRWRYHIQGLVLQIDYGDGLREQRLLIADPKDPSGGIWLDGEAYVRRR